MPEILLQKTTCYRQNSEMLFFQTYNKHQSAKTLRIGLACMAVFFSCLAAAQDGTATVKEQQKLWYKIEVLIFQHLEPDPNSDETLRQPEALDYPDKWRWVSTEQELQKFVESMDAEDMLADVKNDAEIQQLINEFRQNPILVGTVPEEITNPGIGVSLEDSSPMIFEEASSLEEALLNLQAPEEEPPQFLPPRAFVHIEDKEQELAKTWQYLRWSRGFRPLWYRSWHQKIIPESPELGTNILVEGPVNKQGDRLISGSIRFWQESYLHAALDLWMFEYLPNVGQRASPPRAPELRNPTKVEKQNNQQALLFTQIDDRIAMTFAETEIQQSAYQPFQFTESLSLEKDEFALQSPIPDDQLQSNYIDARDLFAKQDSYKPIEVRFIPEDLQSDEILLKTQPVYLGSLESSFADNGQVITPGIDAVLQGDNDSANISNSDLENSQLMMLTAPLIESYKRADFLDLLEQPRKQYRVLQLKEKRRVKRGETHYFDHPYFGLILKITAYQPPEESETE